MRIRRGPATVTGERSSSEGHGPPRLRPPTHAGLEGRRAADPGSQETLVADTSSQGADPE
ncbi:hypothetical protein San01_52050 [Streptomyces angustmyceticus]|uniref:Uncharacterized protein n=1 Tax=Streptomyces angustmyceticus TaxID=285578 RepID=A0A5J4LEX5_9ACTN|nr:hypothetical protein San01_52050 [Streptomyces angustmyceticus]